MKNSIFRELIWLFEEIERESPGDSLLDSTWSLIRIAAGCRRGGIIAIEIRELLARHYLNDQTKLEIRAICSVINLKI